MFAVATAEFASVVATPPDVVTAPVRSVLVIAVALENRVRFPAAGVPVVVTVPELVEPFAADVNLPLASTVIFALV
jgi:hypothetical protein